MESAFAEIERGQSTPRELEPQIARGNEGFLVIRGERIRREQAHPLAATAGDEGHDIIEGDLPVRDIDAQMHLTDLECEGDLEELGQEPTEQREGCADLMLPKKGRGEACLGDDVGELAQACIDMNAWRV
jgi:hypothetical protein